MTTNPSDTVETTIPDGIDMTDPYRDDPAFVLHQGGKLEIASRVPIDGPEDLAPRILIFFRFHGSRRFFHSFFHICGKSPPEAHIVGERPGHHSIPDCPIQAFF